MINIDDLPEPAGWIGYFEGNIVSFLQSREQVNQFLGNTKPAGQVVPVYTEPPMPTKLINVGNVLEQAGYVKKKEWVGLTDKEVEQVLFDLRVKTMGVTRTEDMVRAIEEKLREKNT